MLIGELMTLKWRLFLQLTNHFSILGVSPNCSQEQIRKHYKKIAVLVHPDKNKQAGAEEAFKVLQRSFELIGEPVRIAQHLLSWACL